MEIPHIPRIKILQVPVSQETLETSNEVVMRIDNQSLVLVVQALNLVAAEHSARAFIPTQEASLSQCKIARLIENGMNEAMKGARR
jgi:hypothetical protein